MENNLIVTPTGIIKFPKLQGEENENGKKEYSFVIALDPKVKEVKDMLDQFDKLFAEVKGGTSPMYKDDFDKKEGEEKTPSGPVAINLKSQYPVQMYDANKQKVDVNVGWGTKAKVAIKIGDHYDFRGKKGVKKYPIALQIIELKEAGYTADSIGFQDEADGFEADPSQEVPF